MDGSPSCCGTDASYPRDKFPFCRFLVLMRSEILPIEVLLNSRPIFWVLLHSIGCEGLEELELGLKICRLSTRCRSNSADLRQT